MSLKKKCFLLPNFFLHLASYMKKNISPETFFFSRKKVCRKIFFSLLFTFSTNEQKRFFTLFHRWKKNPGKKKFTWFHTSCLDIFDFSFHSVFHSCEIFAFSSGKKYIFTLSQMRKKLGTKKRLSWRNLFPTSCQVINTGEEPLVVKIGITNTNTE